MNMREKKINQPNNEIVYVNFYKLIAHVLLPARTHM